MLEAEVCLVGILLITVTVSSSPAQLVSSAGEQVVGSHQKSTSRYIPNESTLYCMLYTVQLRMGCVGTSSTDGDSPVLVMSSLLVSGSAKLDSGTRTKRRGGILNVSDS